VKLSINGEARDLPQGLTVAGLLETLNLHPKRVAVERNKQIVRRAHFSDTALQTDDKIEIVTLAGGG
jgi:thiamine biosynthesis protein ThiS